MTDLIKKLCSQIGDDVSHVYDREALFREAADEIERLRAACAEWAEVSQRNYERAKAAEAAPPVGVTVKPLVWEAARDGYPFKWQAWCDLMSGYYYAESDGQKREHEAARAARILSALAAPPGYTRAEVEAAVKRALEAAQQECHRAAFDGLYAQEELAQIGCLRAKNLIRALAADPAAVARIVEGG